MKKILYFLSICLLSACSDDFLTVYPESSLSEGGFYQSEEEFILLANGCYVPMRDYEKDLHWVVAELISDNTSFQYNIRTGEAVRGVIDQFVLSADNRAYAEFWNLSYNGINRCNKLLQEIDRPGVSWSKESLRERSAGEALFLRGLYYFNLVRQFGGVPLVLEPISAQEAITTERATEAQVYESIVSDLEKATARLAASSDVQEEGRIGETAAQALLGKVHLTLQQYTEAEPALQSVIASGQHGLLADYAAIFDPTNENTEEIVFAIQYSENSRELASRFIFRFAPWTSAGEITNRPNINMISAGWNQPTQDLINAFEPGDQRKDVSINFWNGEDWDGEVRDIPYCGKYKAPISAPDDRTGDNMPVIRYSDVLLMYAEVLNALGRTGEAIPYVAQVRARAGLTDPLEGYDQASLSQLIADERQREFCFENQRWYDLKRTDQAVAVMTAHGNRENDQKPFLYNNAYQIEPYKLQAPLPAEQILINGLEQNPGY